MADRPPGDGSRLDSAPWDPRLLERAVVAACAGLLAVTGVLALRWDRPAGVTATSTAALSSSSTEAPSRQEAPSAAPDVPAPGPGGVVDGPTATTTGRRPGTAPDHAGGPPAAASPPSTIAVASAGTGPAIRPLGLHAPEAGRYPIRVVADGTAATGSLVVGDDHWQRHDLGSAGTQSEHLGWSREGAVLLGTGAPGSDGACTWEGRALWVPADLRDGRTWSSRVTCSSTVSGEPVQLVRVETATATKRARTTFDGAPLDTWVIERHLTVTIRSADFTTTSDALSDELFAPGLGLAVYRASRTDVPMPDGSTKSVYASEELLGPPKGTR